MSKNIKVGGRYVTAAGFFVNANGEPIQEAATETELQFDNLTQIRGIGDERQNELTAMGIRTFQQLIEADIDAMDKQMEVSKRTIKGWKRQAEELNVNK